MALESIGRLFISSIKPMTDTILPPINKLNKISVSINLIGINTIIVKNSSTTIEMPPPFGLGTSCELR